MLPSTNHVTNRGKIIDLYFTKPKHLMYGIFTYIFNILSRYTYEVRTLDIYLRI